MFLKEKEGQRSPLLMTTGRSHLMVIDMQERFLGAIPGLKEAAFRASLLCQAAARLEIPVSVSQQNSKALGETVQEVQTVLPPAVSRFEKMNFSLFDVPEAADALRASRRSQFILCGVETHVCVLQTAFDILENLGAQVLVVRDATASRKDSDRDVALTRLAAAGVQLVTTEMVIFEWLRKAGSPEFKALQALVK